MYVVILLGRDTKEKEGGNWRSGIEAGKPSQRSIIELILMCRTGTDAQKRLSENCV